MSRLEKIRTLIERNPSDPFARYGLAMELRNLGQAEEAADTFRELLEHVPDYVPAFLHYGAVLLELDQEQEARRVFSQGMKVASTKGDQHAYEELQAAVEML